MGEDFGVGLAFGFLHYLAHEETLGFFGFFAGGFDFGDGVGVSGEDLVEEGFEVGGVGLLDEVGLLGDGFGVGGVVEHGGEDGGGGGGVDGAGVDELGELGEALGGDVELVDGAVALVGGFEADLGDEVGNAFGVGTGLDGLVEVMGGGAVGGEDGGVVIA